MGSISLNEIYKQMLTCPTTESDEQSEKTGQQIEHMTKEEIITNITKWNEERFGGQCETYKEIVNILKQITWIPVSKRLPEDSGDYLVSMIIPESDGDYEMVGVSWFAHDKDYPIEETRGWRVAGIGATVVAWMPLPKPYKS